MILRSSFRTTLHRWQYSLACWQSWVLDTFSGFAGKMWSGARTFLRALRDRLRTILSHKPDPVEAQPLGFLSIAAPFALLSWLKIGAAVVASGFLAFQAGQWLGDREGYGRRKAEEAAATAALNAELARQAADLAAERAKLTADRTTAANAARGSLADFPPALSKECAAKCSMPAAARDKLEAIK